MPRIHTSTQKASMDLSRWRDFVHTNKLRSQCACAYYLGEGEVPKNSQDTERCERLIREVLLDACAIGAITPPADVEASEFVVKLSSPENSANSYSYYKPILIALSVVREGKTVQQQSANFYLEQFIGPQVKLSAYEPMINVLGGLVSRLE